MPTPGPAAAGVVSGKLGSRHARARRGTQKLLPKPPIVAKRLLAAAAADAALLGAEDALEKILDRVHPELAAAALDGMWAALEDP